MNRTAYPKLFERLQVLKQSSAPTNTSDKRLIALCDLAGASPSRRARFVLDRSTDSGLTRYQLRYLLSQPVERRNARNNMVLAAQALLSIEDFEEALSPRATTEWLLSGGDIQTIFSLPFADFILASEVPSTPEVESFASSDTFFKPFAHISNNFSLPFDSIPQLHLYQREWLNNLLYGLNQNYPVVGHPYFRWCLEMFVASMIHHHQMELGSELDKLINATIRLYSKRFPSNLSEHSICLAG